LKKLECDIIPGLKEFVLNSVEGIRIMGFIALGYLLPKSARQDLFVQKRLRAKIKEEKW